MLTTIHRSDKLDTFLRFSRQKYEGEYNRISSNNDPRPPYYHSTI